MSTFAVLRQRLLPALILAQRPCPFLCLFPVIQTGTRKLELMVGGHPHRHAPSLLTGHRASVLH